MKIPQRTEKSTKVFWNGLRQGGWHPLYTRTVAESCRPGRQVISPSFYAYPLLTRDQCCKRSSQCTDPRCLSATAYVRELLYETMLFSRTMQEVRVAKTSRSCILTWDVPAVVWLLRWVEWEEPAQIHETSSRAFEFFDISQSQQGSF